MRNVALCSLLIFATWAAGWPVGAVAQDVMAIGAPVRPFDSTKLRVTAGRFISYGISADPALHVVAERLTLWDATKEKVVVLTVGPLATIDGVPIRCTVNGDPHGDSIALEIMSRQHMCAELPVKLVPGKTWLTLIYWAAPTPRNDLQIRDQYPGTDEIHTLLNPEP